MAMIGQAGALQFPTTHMTVGRGGKRPRWIIIHGAASGAGYPAQSTGRDFQTTNPNSAHYVIGYDGTLVQCVSENDTAWGNGVRSGPSGIAPMGGGNSRAPHDSYWDAIQDINGVTISIEHEKSTDNTSALSAAQQITSFNLIAGIISRWGIPGHYGDASGGITGHYSMDPANRAYCPGTYPWAALFSYLGSKVLTPYGGGSGTVSYTGGTSGGPTTTNAPLSFTPLLQQVHQTLINTPGFYGIALALDEAESFPGYIDVSQPQNVDISVPGLSGITGDIQFQTPDIMGTVRSVGASITDNFMPFAIRSGLVVIGVLIVLSLLLKVAGPGIKDVALVGALA